MSKEIHCCGCTKKVQARLTDGKEIYPHRKDLYSLPFWKCDACGNYVGTHYKTANPTQPLGCIPTKEIKAERMKIHRILDPLWKSGGYGRKEIYEIISARMGGTRRYHTAQVRSVDEARQVLEILSTITPKTKKEKVS